MAVSHIYSISLAICLASIVIQSFGEIVVLRHLLSERESMRKLTCITEDDGSALIWNYNKFIHTDFKPKSGAKEDIDNCVISNSTQCFVEWKVKESKWKVTNSSVNPMGPVFNYRWEDFPEFVFEERINYQKYRYVGKVSKSSGAAVFSVRGSNNIHLFHCVHKSSKKGLCFWIILAGWEGERSVIRICEKGRPPDQKAPEIGECKDLAAVAHKTERIINEYEWRTFTLKWTSDTKTIQIFRETDRENEPFLHGTVDQHQWGPVSHISMRCERDSRVRFHFYTYLLTERKDAVISTQEFKHDDENFCVEMLVGLCPECKLKVDVVHERGSDVEGGIIHGNEKSVHNEMLTWKLVKLRTTLEISNRKSIKLEIRTILNGNGGKGQWAIGDIRTCKSVGSMRESTITIRPDKKSHPVLICQKLSHHESVLIDALSTKTINSDTVQTQPFISELVKFCGPSCTSFDEGWLLCNPIGCTCGRGFMGSRCTEKCDNGSYGYNCNANCTNCNHQRCDRFTGSCTSPSCVSTTEIEKPTVTNVTDTSVRIRHQLKLEKGTVVSIQIAIKEKDEYNKSLLNLTESGLHSIYEAYISNLKPDKIYKTQTVVTVKQKEKDTCTLTSLESTFTTTCSGQPLFIIEPEDTTITITVRNDTQPCPHPEGVASIIHKVQIYEPRNKTVIDIFNTSFPYTQRNLTPYTEYEVSMFNPRSLYITTIRTLDSGVRKLRVESKSDTEVTLRWDPPLYTNGHVRNYDISLEVNVLFGCNDTRKPTPPQNMTLKTVNDTTANITGLHPYAEYKATVVAYTTKPGKVEAITFQTDEKSIPTSVVSNLQLVNGNVTLQWEKPEDCTTITGPAEITKLLFAGVSDSVRNWTAIRQTSLSYIHLHKLSLDDFTWYNVRAYVIRNYDLPENSNASQKVKWRTPPDAPPAVRNLETFDADSENHTVSLRWKPPSPPKGEIEFYRVIITKENREFNSRTINVSEEESKCRLWGDHVCVEGLTNITAIEVYAKNKGVEKLGDKTTIRIDSTLYEKAPSKPKNLTWIPQGHGIVKLNWSYPEITPTKLKLFYIHVNFISSNLSEYKTAKFPMMANCSAIQNQKNYSTRLHLLPSTVYNVSIVAANRLNSNSTEVKTTITVPGDVAFENDSKLQVKRVGTLLEIKIPTVVNATRDTTVSVIVKGATTCKRLSEWVAGVYKENENSNKPLTIGANSNHGAQANCSFNPGESYEIVLVARDYYSGVSANITSSRITWMVDEESEDPNFAWLVIFPVLAILVLIFVKFRKPRRIRKSENNVSDKDELVEPWNQLKPSTPLPEERNNRVLPQFIAPDVVPQSPDSYVVEIAEFEEYTEDALASGLLELQYTKFTRGLTKPCEYGKLPENKSKNRYKDLIAYDETRVVLKKLPKDPHSDYINASYIQGYRKEKGYIATQGPKANTVNDFWRMIWQEEVRVICMLANVIEGGKKKCEQYWPDIGTNQEYGNILVWNTDHQVFVDYTVRTFILRFKKEDREVTHLHYTGWPDHGVPMYTQSLVPYLKKLTELSSENEPVVVHCSAGVGRTGTIILCDICLRQAKMEKKVDLPAVTIKLRENRPNMVDNLQQYVLAHLVIVESTISEQTQVPCDNDLQYKLKELRKHLPSHIKRLNDSVWQDRALHCLAIPKRPIEEDVIINENPELFSGSPDVAAIEVPPAYDSRSKYVTTVGVDGLKMKNQYIASRMISPFNRSNFWKLIADENIELIIILQSPDPNDPTCCDIMPDEPIFNPTRHIQVETKDVDCKEEEEEQEEQFKIDKLLLTDKSGDEARPQPITVLTCVGWVNGKEGKPPPVKSLVSLWRTSEKISRKAGSTFVLCHDGITGCGLYLALSFLLERMAVERECDVISAVRAVRRFKPEFVQSLEQFEYLYDAAVNYDECFQTYANFS